MSVNNWVLLFSGVDEASGVCSNEAKQLMAAICGRASGLATQLSVMVNTLFAMASILEHQVRPKNTQYALHKHSHLSVDLYSS